MVRLTYAAIALVVFWNWFALKASLCTSYSCPFSADIAPLKTPLVDWFFVVGPDDLFFYFFLLGSSLCVLVPCPDVLSDNLVAGPCSVMVSSPRYSFRDRHVNRYEA
jgi:hypothetical protein